MLERICIILAANLIFYARTIRYKYVSDDIPVSQQPPIARNKWHKRYLQFIGAAKYSNIDYIPYFRKEKGIPRLRMKTSEHPSQQMEHLITLLIHAAICVMIYLALGRDSISFLAALLFAFNPVNNQGSVWISGRGYTLPALSLMTAMAFPYIGPVFLFFCSFFTAGFLAPLALLGSPQWALILIMPWIWYIHSKKFKKAVLSKKDSETYAEDKRFRPRKILLAIKTFGFYLVLCLFPYKITFYHSFLQSCAGNKLMRKRAYFPSHFFWIGLGSIIAWIVHSCHHWDAFSWGFFFFAVNIAPYCNLIRINQEIAERFAYIANIGLMFLLSNLIIHYPLAIAVVLVFYMTRMWYLMPMYMDDYWITEYAVTEDPGAWYAWHVRGMKRWGTQSYKEALILWVMAKLISPHEFKVLMNIASVLRCLKNKSEADYFLKLAAENIVEGQEEEAWRLINEHKQGKLPILQ